MGMRKKRSLCHDRVRCVISKILCADSPKTLSLRNQIRVSFRRCCNCLKNVASSKAIRGAPPLDHNPTPDTVVLKLMKERNRHGRIH